jgi:filamin
MPIRVIASSILSVNVNHSSASKVICSGDDLRMGIIGKEMKCLIDTRDANPGELTAYCQGIHKTAICRLSDHRDGTFTLFIKPEEIGKHLLTIKYNGENIPGSPYTIRVSGAPDAREY